MKDTILLFIFVILFGLTFPVSFFVLLIVDTYNDSKEKESLF